MYELARGEETLIEYRTVEIRIIVYYFKHFKYRFTCEIIYLLIVYSKRKRKTITLIIYYTSYYYIGIMSYL